MIDMMLYFNIFAAIIVLYYAIRGKGQIYDVDYPEEAKKEYCRMIRIFCWCIGIFLLVISIIELWLFNNGGAPIAMTLSWFDIIATLAAVVIFVIVTKRKFGKYQK